MKYIRLDNGEIILEKDEMKYVANHSFVKQADTIEEVCDAVAVFKDWLPLPLIFNYYGSLGVFSKIMNANATNDIKLCIYTKDGLKYVAHVDYITKDVKLND